MREPIFIVEGLRTPVGSASKSLKKISAAQLASLVIKEILQRHRLSGECIDEVVLANTIGAGTGQNWARQAALLGGLQVSVPAFSINHVCGGGLTSIILGARALVSHQAHFILAGGSESASQCPDLIFKHLPGEQKVVQSLFSDGLWCHITQRHMGQLCEALAGQFDISRGDQDQYSFQSHAKACRAITQGKFVSEIVPVKTGESRFFSEDERPRRNINLAKLADLPPAFEKNGTITAGNSTAPADGAAVTLLASQAAVKRHHLKPQARILSYASVGIEPKMAFTGDAAAINKSLKKAGLKLKDIDLFEVGESFAAQVIFTQRELGIPSERMNISGGDIALGHPLGAAGTRILVTLLHALKSTKKKRGLAVICLGGGGAVSMIIERIT